VRGIIDWFARNPVAANLLMALVVVGGFASLPAIQQKTFPDIQVEVIQIAVPYLGAAPEEVEEGVCVRIEEAIQSIDGIEQITSSAAEGACGVSAELLSGYPIDRALTEIKNEVDAISTFPEEAEEPIVSHLTVRRNALQLALAGPASERALKILGERTRDEIVALQDVTQVDVTSARSYEISIEVPEEALRRHGITFDDVVRAVQRGSLDRPGGSIRTTGGEVLLRTVGQAYTGEEFEKIVVLTRDDGTRLLLADVAHVVDGFEEDHVYARFDGEPAVMVRVFRVGDQKVLDLVERVKDYVALAAERLPEGVSLHVWRDDAQSLRDRLDILVRNGRMGFVLVFVVLALFLRLRLAFWVAFGVPVAFLGALLLFPFLEISVDVISVFAFILVLGLLVDDAIVVGENVHRHQERAEEPLVASIRGTQEVSVPVIFGVLTTVAAFLPMIFAPGVFGQIFGAIGAVVLCCLFFSVVESQLVLPAHLGHMKAVRLARGAEPASGAGAPAGSGLSSDSGLSAGWKRLQRFFATSLERLAQHRYRRWLGRAIEWRYATVAGAIALLLVTVAWIGTGRMRFSFFPPIQSDYISARLTMPQGTPIEVTGNAIGELEASAWRVKESLDADYPDAGRSMVVHVMATVGQMPSVGGTGPPGTVANSGGATHLGEVSIELVGGDDRPIDAEEVAQRWRELTLPIADVEELVFASALFSVGDPVDVELQAADVSMLTAAAGRLKERLAEYAGTRDISDSFRDGKREIVLSILPAAQTLGLTLDDLARQVRQAFYGAEAQRIQRGRDDIRVMVRYPAAQRRSLADLENLRVRTPDGGEVPFYAVARAEPGVGFATIKRRDRQRVINVTADVNREEGNEGEILSDLESDFLPGLVAEFPGLSYSFEGAQREQRKAMASLARNYLFAIVAIYALLAIPLRSYGQPLIIMAVIPFGLVGAVLGHVIRRIDLSMMSVWGIVALTGVVVNASLVLVHNVNQHRAEGVPLGDAVREAGVVRFRPVVLTSLTTFAGLLPLLFERSVSAQFLIPMGTSLGFGVLFSGALSLFLVPCSYMILEDLRTLFHRDGTPPAAELHVLEDVRQGLRAG
jgi:multidrug efflux pump subunit AcrB